MNKKPGQPAIPSVTAAEIGQEFRKSEAILLRMTPTDKEAITSAAKALHLTATEFLVKSALIVAAKVSKSSE